ncbi:MAG: response regulator [Pseudomonadota bacterium]
MKAPPTRHRRILVVDDNRDAADTLAMLLEFLDYEVRTAYDGKEAVDIAAEFQPQLVILDIHMPQMNGYEAARQLRGRSGGQRTVLVALTAIATPEAQHKAKEAGFDIHLAKPVDGGELAHLLERVLH